ncbi:MAG TPA: helix-turn-helix domain-containing protein [Myxococcota bacterium]|jgi:AcrR family transcriptional regulator
MAESRKNRAGGRDAAEAARPDRRKLKGQVSRERILDAALQLFSERGYAATPVHEIARQAGIEKAALYWHFGSKEGLLAAVLDRMDAEFVERIAKKVSLSSGSDERLDLYVNGLKRLAAERGHLVRLTLSVAIERSKISPESRGAMLRIFERTRAAVEQGFELALGARLPDLDLIARLSLAYLFEASVRAAIDPDHAEHDRFFAHLRRLIALDVEHQIRESGVAVDRSRLPTRR